jgi:hypothetical protein
MTAPDAGEGMWLNFTDQPIAHEVVDNNANQVKAILPGANSVEMESNRRGAILRPTVSGFPEPSAVRR